MRPPTTKQLQQQQQQQSDPCDPPSVALDGGRDLRLCSSGRGRRHPGALARARPRCDAGPRAADCGRHPDAGQCHLSDADFGSGTESPSSDADCGSGTERGYAQRAHANTTTDARGDSDDDATGLLEGVSFYVPFDGVSFYVPFLLGTEGVSFYVPFEGVSFYVPFLLGTNAVPTPTLRRGLARLRRVSPTPGHVPYPTSVH